MEIDSNQFPYELVKIIEYISEASFVAIDLEFTGLAARRNQSNGLSLQELYEDTKLAAERYQILQFGMTVVTEDLERGTYVLRPYNFFINPVPMRFTKVERIWSFQSGAVEFLTRHNFNFDKPYKLGVPYLSRKEASTIRNQAAEPIPDMPIKSQDKAFANAVRQAIDDWLAKDPLKRDRFLNLPPETAPAAHATKTNKTSSPGPQVSANRSQKYKFPASFTRFQMRLIYQIVRNEYEKRVVALGNRNWMQLIPYDQIREDALKVDQEQYKERDISKATEFRWIIEALAGGDVSKIESNIFLAALPSDSKAREDPKALGAYIESLQAKLDRRRRILIGHNLFTDLVMIYRCFIGDLPSQVQDFQRAIHDLFPAIIDTKWMASRGTYQGSGSSTLGDLDYALKDRTSPIIEVPQGFDRYTDLSSYHEAGFDSLMTAKVAIRLSTQLEEEKKYEPIAADQAPSSGSEDEYYTPLDSSNDEENPVGSMFSSITSLFSAAVKSVTNQNSGKAPTDAFSQSGLSASKISAPQNLRPIESDPKTQLVKPGPANWANPEQLENLRKVFARSSISSVIEGDTANSEQTTEIEGVGEASSGAKDNGLREAREQSSEDPDANGSPKMPKREISPQLMTFSSDDEADSISSSGKNKDKSGKTNGRGHEGANVEPKKKSPQMMPQWDTDFWKIFGNKLRVYGCNEGVCRL